MTGADRSRTLDDRGQLLLVGAIAIALVLIGLVVVFNTVLYTDATSPTDSLEAADEAERMNQQARNDTRRLMKRVANESTTTVAGVEVLDNSSFDQNMQENMTKYSNGLARSVGHTGPTFVNVTVLDVGVDDAGGYGLTCSSEDLCVEFEFVYSTEEFTYRRTQTVEADSPVSLV